MFMPAGMKNILIKNATEEDIKDIYLTYEGLEKHPLKISKIRKDGQEVKTLALNHLIRLTKLVLFYYVNDEKQEILAYDKLSKEDLRSLVLTISRKDNKLQIEATIDEKYI